MNVNKLAEKIINETNRKDYQHVVYEVVDYLYLNGYLEDRASLLKKQRESCSQSLIQAKLPEGTMSFPEWNYSKMNQMQVRDYILNAPDE